jgi:hypothetical protein
MNCQPQKEILKVADIPNKEVGCAFGMRYYAKKSGEKMKKSIRTSGY